MYLGNSVELGEESTNQLFETLEDWNTYLNSVDLDLEGPSP